MHDDDLNSPCYQLSDFILKLRFIMLISSTLELAYKYIFEQSRSTCFALIFLYFVGSPNMVVLITDGQSNIDHFETLPEAQRMKREGITILTLAVGFSGATAELTGMTSPPIHENLFYVDDFYALQELTDYIIRPICTGQLYR